MIYAHLIDKNQNPITEDYPIHDADQFEQMIDIARAQDVTCAIKWQRSKDGQVAYWSPNGASFEPHWYNGNKNAAKDDGATSFIHARCKPSDKAKWVKASQSEGLKLTEWIVKSLNSAAH